jgi:hypothetical protein
MKTKKKEITMNTRVLKRVMGCLVAAAMMLGMSATARAADDTQACSVCSVGMVKGLYLWTFDGYADFGAGLVPKAVMQGTRFNGDGTTVNAFGTVNIGGSIIIDATGGVGTYTVAADCTGTLTITDGPSFNIYVGPNAKQLWITQVAGSAVGLGVGTATRVPGR